MANITETLFSAEVLAIAIPAIIFAITIILVVKRLVGFVITLLLLLFSLGAGLAIINHDVVRDYVRGEYSDQQVQTWKEEVTKDLQKVWDSLKDLKDQLIKQDEESTEDAQAWFGKIEQRLGELEDLVEDTHVRIGFPPQSSAPEAITVEPEKLTADPSTAESNAESLE